MLEQKLAIVGGGNMGGALLRGILTSGLLPADRVTVVDREPKVLDSLREEHGVGVTADLAEGVSEAGTILLAVKPFVVAKVLDGLAGCARGDQLVVSVVAGVHGSTLRDRIGKDNPVVRAMPNLPATVGEGATAVAACPPATEEHLQAAEAIFASVGEVVRVEESALDAVTGLSGSGPGFVFTVIEALADGGVGAGLPRAIARDLAVQTVLGAARLVRESGDHPAVLRDRVTTPGGTTIAGLAALERGGLRSALFEAVAAAAARSRELSGEA